MILYRPVGQAEYDLIAATDFSAYPPRLSEQPIFYPVLNERYAREICDKWNRRRADAQYTGYVTTFEIDDDYAARFPVQTVGACYHQELWVPAEELEEFNRYIIGKISVVSFVGREGTCPLFFYRFINRRLLDSICPAW